MAEPISSDNDDVFITTDMVTTSTSTAIVIIKIDGEK